MRTYCGKAVALFMLMTPLMLHPAFAQDHNLQGHVLAAKSTAPSSVPPAAPVVSPTSEIWGEGFDSARFSVDYAIQVGAFAHRAYAVKLKQKLAKAGYKVDVYDNFIDGKKLLHLVWVGTYSSESEAQAERAAISQQFKIDGVIRARTAWPHN